MAIRMSPFWILSAQPVSEMSQNESKSTFVARERLNIRNENAGLLRTHLVFLQPNVRQCFGNTLGLAGIEKSKIT